jgi:hypothetical protein
VHFLVASFFGHEIITVIILKYNKVKPHLTFTLVENGRYEKTGKVKR